MTSQDNEFETLTTAQDGPIATITLNRPDALNAINQQMRHEMLLATRWANAKPEVRVVIIKGEGRGFCAGADLASGKVENPVSDVLDHEYKPFMKEIVDGEKIFIAQVHGAAAGIGAAVAMACDLVVMSEDAYIYMAFQAISLVPDGGNTWLLLQQLGYHRALELILEGRKLPASECVSYGLANKAVPQADLDQVTLDWAGRLAGKAPLSLAASKRLLRQVGQKTYSEAFSMEAQEQNPLIQSNDFRRGVAAFFDKTTPQFEGN